ncbi:MAG TPA: DUF4386 domain-containing protein [Holophagaceae bacterium]|nr:DUF4386 domain-containing protein [Holophagaceae bacterium]
MTRTTLARIAGATYLVYAAIGIGGEALMHQARSIDPATANPVRLATYALDLRLTILIVVLECLSALVLAVTLYGITRDEDADLARLGLVCRVTEGILGSLSIPGYVGMLALAKAGGQDAATANAVRTFQAMPGPSVPPGAVFFAVGSLVFAWLLLRGRMVPGLIAWLGVLACGLLTVLLPLQLAGFTTGPLTGYVPWLPALLFQVVLALWLVFRGVR